MTGTYYDVANSDGQTVRERINDAVNSVAYDIISGFRNLIENPAMLFDQRYEGGSTALSTGTGLYVADRWIAKFVNSTASGVTCQRVSDAPAGFTYSAKITVGTGGSSVGASDYLVMYHPIKGNSLRNMGFGASGASAFSVSFWVKSSISGTFTVSIENAASDRSYTATYTINATNTWEYKTIENISGDTSGTWVITSATGMRLVFLAGSGSSVQTSSLSSWQAQGYRAANTATNTHLTTTGATFQVTGVQIEPGPIARVFEFRPYMVEKNLCKAHYRKTFAEGTVPAQNAGTTGAIGIVQPVAASTSTGFGWQWFDVEMRAAPSITVYNPSAANAQMRNLSTGNDTSSTATAAASPLGFRIAATTSTGGGAGNTNAYHMTADADIT